jgi:predicted PurR-regulated permease PerM
MRERAAAGGGTDPARASHGEGERQLTGRSAAASRHTAAPRAAEPLEFEASTDISAPPAAVAEVEEGQRRDALQRSAWWWIRAAAITVTLFVSWQLLLIAQSWVAGLLAIVLFMVFGAVVALVASPVMRGLERARIPHVPAVLGALLSVMVVVAGLVYLVAGPLGAEITALVRQGPRLLSEAQQELGRIQQTLNAHGITVGNGSGGIGGLLGGNAVAQHLGQVVITGITGVVTVLVDTVIVLVTAFWLLNDGPRLRQGFVQMLPGRIRDHADFAIDATQVVIGGYVRAQLFLAFVIGGLAWIGCTLLGVPYPVVVGVAAGVFELVPLLGPFLGGAVGVALALTRDPVLALWTVLLFVGIHIVEGYILAPRVQGRFIQLHPLVAFLALISGIEVAGLLGALFAVPATSLAAVFLRATIGDWRANRPEVFQSNLQDVFLERRRRTLLGEFRVMRHTPRELLLRYGPPGWWRRLHGRPVPDPATSADDDLDPGSGGPV